MKFAVAAILGLSSAWEMPHPFKHLKDGHHKGFIGKEFNKIKEDVVGSHIGKEVAKIKEDVVGSHHHKGFIGKEFDTIKDDIKGWVHHDKKTSRRA
jgi:hypothetical protein